MMSPRLPLHLLSHVRRARRLRAPLLATASACLASLAIATAATPAAAGTEQRAASRAWSPWFEQQRPVPATDARRVVVLFDDPSLAEWTAASRRTLGADRRAAWLRQSGRLQQRRLDALAASGVQFRIEHRYLRVLNGASIVVHGDGAQLLRSEPGVSLVTPVRSVWPAAAAGSTDAEGAAGAAAAAGAAVDPGASGRVRVAVLDTGIDGAHPAVHGRLGDGFDATADQGRRRGGAVEPDEHGTSVAATVLRSAGAEAGVQVLPVRVMSKRPTRDGAEAVLGDSDDVLAGLEHAVDPDRDGSTADGAHVALVAATTPFAGFADSPEDRAVRAADTLGTVVVAAAGNDGASGDEVGTTGSFAASTSALAVGAADLRDRTAAVDVRIEGGGIDETFEDAPLLTPASVGRIPAGSTAVVALQGSGAQVVDYLDSDLRSRVSGSIALVGSVDGVAVAAQVRAAADAGAVAVLVAGEGTDAAAETVAAAGVDIPAIGISRERARALRDVLAADEQVEVTLRSRGERNPAFGTAAGFSSGGPRFDGVTRPDLLAPGVGMVVPAPGGAWRTSSGTSIAAAWAAGAAAAVRAAHGDWSPAQVRGALMGTALPLGATGDRPEVSVQGAGVVDAARATAARAIVDGGRIDFGAVAPGADVREAFQLRTPDGELVDAPRMLLDDGGRSTGVGLTLESGQLVLAVPASAKEGAIGGWLVLPDQDVRIPWTATVRAASRSDVPVRASVTNRTLRPVAGPGAFASTLTIGIGGSGDAEELGIEAAERVDVRLLDRTGRDRGSLGGLDHALPGIYTFGLTGVDAAGTRLKPGRWTLRVRYVPATDPGGDWRQGPSTSITVTAARRAR